MIANWTRWTVFHYPSDMAEPVFQFEAENTDASRSRTIDRRTDESTPFRLIFSAALVSPHPRDETSLIGRSITIGTLA